MLVCVCSRVTASLNVAWRCVSLSADSADDSLSHSLSPHLWTASHSLTRDRWTHADATASCFLEDLELPGVLVLVIQAVHCGEAQFPGLLVLVVQAVYRGEAQGGRGAVALRGQWGWGLAEGATHWGHGDGAESSPGARQLRVHGGKVGTAVQASEVGGGAGVALGVRWWLAVAHRVRWGPLHARGRGGGQGVGQRRNGRAPDGHSSVPSAGALCQRGPWLSRRGAVGAGWVRNRVRGTGLLHGRGLLLGRPGFGLAAALLLLLTALGTAVFKPNLGTQWSRGFSCQA